jgi:hypothetical protein
VRRRLGADQYLGDICAKETEVMATDIHAEHVGSLLRQPWLLAARAEYKAGEIAEGARLSSRVAATAP